MGPNHPWWYVRNLHAENGANPPVSGWWHVRNIVLAWAANVVWVTFVVAVLKSLLVEQVGGGSVISQLMSPLYCLVSHSDAWQAFAVASPLLGLFMVLIFAPFVEEAMFRVLPLTLVKFRDWETIRIVVLVICGVIFGWAHGSALNVLIQGFGGLTLAWVYLRNRTSLRAGYLSAVCVHFMYNATVTFLAGI